MGKSDYRKKVVKTCKSHQCYDCGRTIPPGSTATYSVTWAEGDFRYGHFCTTCVEPVKEG